MIPHSFPEPRFEAVGRPPHNAAGHTRRARAESAVFPGIRMHSIPERTAWFSSGLLHAHPGFPPNHRSAGYLVGRARKLSQTVLPPRQEPALDTHSYVESSVDLSTQDRHRYQDADGLITMCVSCHRMQRPGTEEWDRVPQWEASPPAEITGGICVACFQQHYARYLPTSDDSVA